MQELRPARKPAAGWKARPTRATRFPWSQPVSWLQRQEDNRVSPLFGFGCCPHQQEFFDRLPYVELL